MTPARISPKTGRLRTASKVRGGSGRRPPRVSPSGGGRASPVRRRRVTGTRRHGGQAGPDSRGPAAGSAGSRADPLRGRLAGRPRQRHGLVWTPSGPRHRRACPADPVARQGVTRPSRVRRFGPAAGYATSSPRYSKIAAGVGHGWSQPGASPARKACRKKAAQSPAAAPATPTAEQPSRYCMTVVIREVILRFRGSVAGRPRTNRRMGS